MTERKTNSGENGEFLIPTLKQRVRELRKVGKKTGLTVNILHDPDGVKAFLVKPLPEDHALANKKEAGTSKNPKLPRKRNSK